MMMVFVQCCEVKILEVLPFVTITTLPFVTIVPLVTTKISPFLTPLSHLVDFAGLPKKL